MLVELAGNFMVTTVFFGAAFIGTVTFGGFGFRSGGRSFSGTTCLGEAFSRFVIADLAGNLVVATTFEGADLAGVILAAGGFAARAGFGDALTGAAGLAGSFGAVLAGALAGDLLVEVCVFAGLLDWLFVVLLP